MSIAILTQVYDETRRLAIAGSSLAVGDFRLKKLLPPLKKAGAKAPVFGKLAESIERLIGGNEKDSPQALLDLSSLVIAILYTQGETGLEGKATEIKSLALPMGTTQVSSRVIKPLIEALSTTGSGRLETVQEAFERGVFDDLRLVNPAVQALDDVYPELADFVATKVLPKYGQAIVPMIQDQIDIKGRAGNARRLKLLYHLAPELARPVVEQAFENGSKEMKIAALACLGDSKRDLPHLLDQIKARAKDVRRIVLERLARFKGKEIEDVFKKAIEGNDVDLVANALRETENAKLLRMAQEQTKACFEELISAKDRKRRSTLIDRLDVLLSGFHRRADKGTCELLGKLLEDREQLASVGGTSALIERLCCVAISTQQTTLLQQVAELHGEWDDVSVQGFVASAAAVLATHTPKQSFDVLNTYFQRTKGKARGKTNDKYEAICNLLCQRWHFHYDHGYLNEVVTDGAMQLKDIKWDPRWVGLAIKNDELSAVCALATSKDKAAGEFLASYIAKRSKKADPWEISRALNTLVNLKHKKAADLLLQAITEATARKTHHYQGHWLFPLVSKLPKSAHKKVEAVIARLPESAIDQLMPHLVTLRQKS